jgi:Uncharacterized protein conserved in bacteria
MALERQAPFDPEEASSLGLEAFDEQIVDMKPNVSARKKKMLVGLEAELQRRLAAERDPRVKQDLEIILTEIRNSIRGIELSDRYSLPYVSVPRVVFAGLQTLLDDQVAPKRRPAALVRLRRYAGLEKGYKPLTVLAEERIRERMKVKGILGPPKIQVEKDLQNIPLLLDGIEQLFKKYNLTGYEQAYAKLKEQVEAYNDFVRREVLPRSRDDFRLPPELYAYRLKSYGVDIPAEELTAMAHKAFDEIQQEMQRVAADVAKQRGFSSSDYRDVIRELKKEQLAGDTIVDHYRARIGQIEEILRREQLVSLPERPARMRLASPAESAAQPAPHMRPPRLINNEGETGEFVLPLSNPSAQGKRMDDFTFAAASWTLTAHEARPGHEMQFSAMVENGVSTARAIYAFNSTNVEGWGLYSEWMMYPFMPAEGKLISLQYRLLRAARAFLDPELHVGKVTPSQAMDVLTKDVVLSEAMATQEVDRYTFRSPAQATSYFYGYTRLLELRRDSEKRLGPKFNQREFHDFILSQGLLPPALLRKAVEEKFRP